MTNYNFSIIIPHYNDYERLCRCISSIPDRSDIQIVIVDDVSDKDIFNSVCQLKKGACNIEVYQNYINSGAGTARNLGIEKSKGDWLLFADCDDYFTNEAFFAFDKYVNSIFDIVYFDAIINNQTDNLKVQESNRNNIKELLSKKNVKKIRTSNWEPWGKMFKRSFIISNKISFSSTRVMNDAYFSISAGLHAKNIFGDLEMVYEYVVYNNSISRQINIEKDIVRIREINKINKMVLSYKNFYLYTIDLMFPIIWFIKSYGMKSFSRILDIFRNDGVYLGIPFYSLIGKLRRNLRN